MIKITQGYDPKYMSELELTALEALSHLVQVHLMYAGSIVEVSPTLLKVESHVIGQIDTCIYTGSVEEMAPLHQITNMYLETIANHGDKLTSIAVDQSLKYGDNTFIFIAMAPMLQGKAIFKAMVATALGVTEQATIEKVAKMDFGEIFAAKEMAIADGSNLEEVLALVA